MNNRPISYLWVAAAALLLCTAGPAWVPALAQAAASETAFSDSAARGAPDELPDAPQAQQTSPPAPQTQDGQAPQQPGAVLELPGTTPAKRRSDEGRQTKRILFIVPNFRAVSADEHLRPQSPGDKFKTATLDSVDYSSFIFVGIQAGIAQATKSYPQFQQGAAGFGRYYWHTLADTIDENLWVEFLLPTPLHEDTRYYTLGRGPFPKRLAYSFTRTLITRTDGGRETFNASEIIGAGAASGVSSLYYPTADRTWTKVGQRWLTSVLIDGGTFVFKEFWPDLNNTFFHQRD